MKKLTCEMCGSTELLKQEGVFACQNCGCQYSIEEAKKLMIEGVVEVKGEVKIDNSSSVNNYLKLAKTSYASKNNAEAEKYANNVIEIEPNNFEAWMIKGKAAGWQSTLANPRFPECVSAFGIAVENVPEEKFGAILKEIKEEIISISCALIKLRAERFVKWPDKEEASGFISDITTIINTLISFISDGITVITVEEVMSPISMLITQSVEKAYNTTIYPEYKSDKYPYPDDDDLNKYIIRVDLCIALMNKAIGLSDGDEELDIKRYEKIIEFHKNVCNACSYDWFTPKTDIRDKCYADLYREKGYIVDVAKRRIYFKNKQLKDDAIIDRDKSINKCHAEIETLKEKIAIQKIRGKNDQETYDIAVNNIKYGTINGYEEAIKGLNLIRGFKDSAILKKECEENINRLKREEKYKSAVSKMEEGREMMWESCLDEALVTFNSMPEYKDSKKRIEICRSLLSEIREKKNKEEKKQKRKIIIALAVGVVLLLLIMIVPRTLGNINDSKTVDYSTYSENGVTYAKVDFHFEGKKDIVIKDKYKGYSVKKISDYVFCEKYIESIVIPSSVTHIGDFAFDCYRFSNPTLIVYYTGSKEEWEKIEIGIGNGYLESAIIHYNYVP